MPPRPPRGRPVTRTDREILEAALTSFARDGYDAMSIRALNKDLGLSHEAVRQRFGSKEQLFVAAIDHGLADFVALMDGIQVGEPRPDDDLDVLRQIVGTFITAASRRPHLGRIVNHEGLQPSPRLDYIYRAAFGAAMLDAKTLIDRLIADGRIRTVGVRELFFLAQGAAGAFALRPLSESLDEIDGPVDPEQYIERTTGILMRGITRAVVE